ncbi:transposase family protein, partial [Paenibacillus sp. GCM10012307]
MPLPVPEAPWREVSVDLITDLPRSVTKDAVFVVVDRFSKMIVLMATTKTCTGETLARLFRDHVVRRFGQPQGIVSDRDPRFAGAFWRALQGLLQTKLRMSSPYRPQTDGQTERMNATILAILRAYCKDTGVDWTEHLPMAEFAYNASVNSVTGLAPFEIVHRTLPLSPPDAIAEELR